MDFPKQDELIAGTELPPDDEFEGDCTIESEVGSPGLEASAR
jgi:hypothetical protein